MKYKVEFEIDLRRNPGPGLYIALEGIDGSGKTTQVEKVVEQLEKMGKTVVKTKEPRDDGVVGSLIRQILKEKVKVPTTALQYLFSADRRIHHEEIVIPALARGAVVITDRCFWSAIPYGIMDKIMSEKQGIYDYKNGELLLAAQGILSLYNQFIVPDFTFYLDISLTTALARLSEKDIQKEIYEEKEKLDKIISGYKWLIEKFPREITVISGEQPVEKVTEEIVSYLRDLGYLRNL